MNVVASKCYYSTNALWEITFGLDQQFKSSSSVRHKRGTWQQHAKYSAHKYQVFEMNHLDMRGKLNSETSTVPSSHFRTVRYCHMFTWVQPNTPKLVQSGCLLSEGTTPHRFHKCQIGHSDVGRYGQQCLKMVPPNSLYSRGTTPMTFLSYKTTPPSHSQG